jgi:hypothetical protein
MHNPIRPQTTKKEFSVKLAFNTSILSIMAWHGSLCLFERHAHCFDKGDSVLSLPVSEGAGASSTQPVLPLSLALPERLVTLGCQGQWLDVTAGQAALWDKARLAIYTFGEILTSDSDCTPYLMIQN